MIIYAHKGNCQGPQKDLENTPQYIREALKNGYGCEIDVWKQNEQLFLGHDEPLYKINRDFLINKNILVHCKNVEAFRYLHQFQNIHSFYHTDEDVVLTTWGKIIKYCDGFSNVQNAQSNEIIISPNRYGELAYSVRYMNPNAYGIVTDDASSLGTSKTNNCFKILLLDVDGVLTNGKKMYDKQHQCVGKEFLDHDFTAIKRFKADGIEVCFVTSDIQNIPMAEIRKIKYINTSGIHTDKSLILSSHQPNFLKQYSLSDMAYVGDDYYDLSLLNSVGYSFCPSNASPIVKENVDTVLRTNGGEGVVVELYELYKHNLEQKSPLEPEHE